MVVQKPGRRRPRRVLAGERPARDLAVSQRVAPVLHAQAPARPRVHGGGDVAHGEHGRVGAAHRGVDEHGPVLDIEAGGGRQLAAGRDAGPEQDEVGGQLLAAGQAHAPARRDALELRAEAQLDARLAQQRGDELARSLAEAVRLRKLLGRGEDRVEPALGQRRRRLAGDEAGADDDARAKRPAPRGAAAGRRPACGWCAGRGRRRRPPAGAGARSRWRARRRRSRAPGPLRGRRAGARGRGPPRGARGGRTPRVPRTTPRSRWGGRRPRPRRAGSPWSAAGARRAGAARRR